MDQLSVVQKIAVWALPLLFAIILHEIAHGWVANKLGDPTAKILGRLSLNPLKHIDPIGTIVLPLMMVALTNFVFGWAKPVPVNWQNLRNPKRDMALVALAGPFTNFLMAIGWALALKITVMIGPSKDGATQWFFYMGQIGILINLVLMVLNMIPIPPLDGSRVVTAFLSHKAAYTYNSLEPYGFFILLGLLFSGVLSKVLAPSVYFMLNVIRQIIGV